MILKSIKIEGLFQKFDYNIQLDKQQGLTILYGLNGIGKTTILNILASFSKFSFLEIFKIPFKTITFAFGPFKGEDSLELNVFFTKKDEMRIDFNIKFNDFFFKQSFSSVEEIENVCTTLQYKYRSLIRKQPELTFKIDMNNPSDEDLIALISGFILKYNCLYIESLRNNLYDFDILEEYYTDKKNKQKGIEKVKNHLKERYEIADPFDIEVKILNDLMKFYYNRKLELISQDLSELSDDNKDVHLFLNVINKYFDFKKLDVENGIGIIITLDDEMKSIIPFTSLSSGEMNLLIIFFIIIFVAKEDSLVLIDEPEISLNINWHYDFMDTLREIGEKKDLYYLIATHSPQIVNDYTHNCIDAEYKEM